MRWSRLLLGDDEPGLRLRPLKPGQARGPKRLVPWWVRAERRVKAARVIRRLSKTSRNGGGRRKLRAAPRPLRTPQRGQDIVPAQRHKGGWVRHARYLAREHAQREQERGLGFDGVRKELDMVGVVREMGAERPT